MEEVIGNQLECRAEYERGLGEKEEETGSLER